MKTSTLVLLCGLFSASFLLTSSVQAQIKNSFYDRVGIGVDDPDQPLHVIGNAIISGKLLDLTHIESSADFTIQLDRDNNSAGSIFYVLDGQANKEFLVTEEGYSQFFGDVRVDESMIIGGTSNTTNNILDVQGANTTSPVLRAEVNYSGNSDVRAIEATSQAADGYGYGVYSTGSFMGVRGTGTGGAYTGNAYGGYFQGTGTAGTRYGVYGLASGGNVKYGVRGAATGSGTTHYGVYGSASGATRNYAVYASGDLKVTSQLFIGTSTTDEDNASAYELLVDGQALIEEVKIELSGNWPDYVFEPEYKRLNLNELEAYVSQHKHLPGVKSAKEVEEEGGHNLGETQRQLLEKIEELTLYLIEVNKEKEALQEQLQALTKRVNELEQK